MKTQTLNYTAQLKEVEELNPSFATGLMRVCYHGKNRNGFVLPKETLEAAIPTFFNCPVVANYKRNTDSIGGHDVELAVKDGKLNLIPVTQPVGVVPTNDMYYWETVSEEDGAEHEYLVMPIVLWKRQEAVRHILDVGCVAESMECVFDETHENDDGDTVVDKMTMQAFCLLESVQPCFESAAIEMIDSSLQEQFALMKNDWKELCGSENFSINNLKQGGVDMEKEKEKSTVENFEHEEPEQETHAEGATGQEQGQEQVVETVEHEEFSEYQAEGTVEETADEPKQVFAAFATYEAKRRAIECALPDIRKLDDDGNVEYSEYYWLEDFDDSFAYVGRRVWKRDEESCDQREQGRFAYELNEDGKAELSGEFEPMVVRWLTIEESNQLDSERGENENLKKWYEEYKRKRCKSLCSEFASLKDIEGYDDVVKAIEDGTLDYDAAQEKFFALKGKYVFSLEQAEPKAQSIVIDVEETPTSNTNRGHRYGGIISASN